MCVPGEGLGEEGAIVSHLLEKKGNMGIFIENDLLKIEEKEAGGVSQIASYY